MCILALSAGRASDYPHLGAAGVFARGYLPEAEVKDREINIFLKLD